MKALFLLISIGVLSTINKNESPSIDITWTSKIEGDFSFSKKQSILCEAWCYEWAGTDKILAKRMSSDTVICYTMMNTATHCSLHLTITGNKCIPTIVLKSIARPGSTIYECDSGTISIDKILWEKKVLKASFDLKFKNDENDKDIFWKGKIYTRVQ